MFSLYLKLGFHHILDINAYDHILFIIALCAIYRSSDWRRVLILVTAFTLGHSSTLAMSALDIISIPSDVISLLIPLTIVVTALYNIRPQSDSSSARVTYILALFFGFIHGMGFSTYFKALLGASSDILFPLFAFNIGVEIGQILIVMVVMITAYVAMNVANIKQRSWNLFVSGMAAGGGLLLILESGIWG